MNRLRAHPRTIRRTAIASAIACCFAPAPGLANPVGPAVVHGQASFATSGKSLTVTNAPGTIINWKGFSIGIGETTRFVQQNAASAVLNRVVGAQASSILGMLQSNGRVFLINPNGIMIGAGAVIDTAGLVASTLNIMDADFLLGKMRFGNTPGAGPISNAGEIRTPLGGRVLLISPEGVENSGIIHSPKGEVILAAGKSVELTDSAHPEVRVEISAPDARAINLGKIVAESGRVGIYGGIVANHGVVSADSAVVGENGKIVFKATREATLAAGSVTSASGPQGGSVEIQSEGTTVVAGRVSATGSADAGGEVRVLGERVGLAEKASVDVSGDRGGGTALIGGDLQGKNPAVQNARMTYVGPDASVKADAGSEGDGGKVIVWADDTTRSYGAISARGGATAGNGGFVETSGKQGLDVRRGPDLRAPAGKPGTWLLDPVDLEVVAASELDPTTNTGAPFFAPLAESSRIGVDLINAQLDFGSNVLLTTTSQGADAGAQAGNITISAPIVKTAVSSDDVFIGTTSLTVQAHNDVVIGPGGSIISVGDPLNVSLQADAFGVGAGGVTVGGTVITRGGSFTAAGAGPIALNAPVNTMNAAGTFGGSVSLTSRMSGVSVAAPVSGGLFSANAQGGATTVASAITSTSSVSLTGRDGVSIGADVATGPFSSFSATATGAGAAFDIDPGATVATRGATLTADSMNIQGVVNANDGTITVRQFANNRPINFGSELAGALSITQLEFANLITTGSLVVGNTLSGAFTVNGSIAGSPSFVTLNSGASYTQNAGMTLSSSLQINAPSITIAAPLSAAGPSGINLTADTASFGSTVTASAGELAVNARTFGRQIILGMSSPTGAALELTDAHSDMLVSPVRVRFATSGPIHIAGPLSLAGSSTLVLNSSSNTVTQAAGATVTVPNLGVTGRTLIDLPEHNDVSNFAARIECCSAGDIHFVAAAGKTVNITAVDGVSGVSVSNFSTGTSNVMLQADDLNIGASVFVNGTGNITFMPETAGRTATLGGDVAGTLSLNNTELGFVNATNLFVNADTINIPGAVTFLAPTTTLGPMTTDRAVQIVGAKTGTVLEFLPSELSNITAGTVVLGGANAGPVSVLTSTTVPGTINKLVLHSAGASSSVTVGLSTPLSATNSIGIMADTVDLQAGVSSTNGSIEVATHTGARNIDVGSDPGPSAGFSLTEIGFMSAPLGTISFTTAGGNIDVTGAVSFPNAATVSFDAGSTFTLLSAGSLSSAGALWVRAPTIDIQGMTSTSALAGNLWLTGNNINIVSAATTLTATGDINVAPRDFRSVNLGAAGVGGDLRLDNSELGVLNPTGVLRIGNASTTGNVAFTAAISVPGETLSLVTGSGTVSQSAGATLTAASLAAKAFSAITLNEANAVGTVALHSDFSSVSFTRATGAPLVVGTVDGLTGIFAGSGSFASPGPVTVRADQIDIDQQMRGSTVTLLPTAGFSIDIGTRSGFGFAQADFDRIVAATGVTIGEAASDDLTVSSPITVSSFSNLSLVTGNAASVGSAVTVPGNLTLMAGSTDVSSTLTSTGGNVEIATDTLNLPGTLSAFNMVHARPLTGTVHIDLGTETGGKLSITDAEVDRMSAPTLRFGTTPRIDITAPITPTAPVQTVELIADDLTVPGAGSLTVPNLSITAASASRTIDLGTSGTGTFMGLDAVTLGKLAVANALAFSVPVPGTGTVSVSAPISLPSTDVTLSANSVQINENLTVAGDLALRSNTPLAIAAGKTVTSTGGGNIEVSPSSSAAMTFGVAGLLNSTTLAQLVTTGFLELGNLANTTSLTIAQPLNAAAFGGLLLRSSGNISQTAGSTITAPNLSATSSGGNVTLTENNAVSGVLSGSAGFFRTFNFTNAIPLTIGTFDGINGVTASSGTVTLRAPSLDIVQPIVANTVTLAPDTAGTAINLGTDSGFGLTDAEIDQVLATTLTIGTSTGVASGPITVDGAVDRSFGTLNLVTAPGSSISVNAPLGSASTGSISMNAGAGGSVNVAAPVHASSNVSVNADSIVTSQPITSDFGSVSLSNFGTNGSVSVGGAISALFSINVTGKTILINAPLTATSTFSSVNLSALAGTSGSSVTINNQITAGNSINVTTDDIAINAKLVTTGSSVSLSPRSAGMEVSIGTEKAGAFSVSSSEIALIDTDSLSIGSSTAGDVEINAPLAGTFEALTLRSAGDVTQTPGSTITVRRVDPDDSSIVTGSLSVFAAGMINLPEANDVAVSVTGTASGTANDFIFNNISPFKLQNVSGVFASGRVLLRAATPTPTTADSAPDALLNSALAAILKAQELQEEAEKRAKEREEEAEKQEREEDKKRGTPSCS